MEIHYLNVDEGDCSIVKHDSGRITMIDICCGNLKKEQSLIEENFSAKKASKEDILGNYNQKEHPTNPLDWLPLITDKRILRFIATHPDMDHLDGLKALFESKFKPRHFWDTKNNKNMDCNFGKYNKEDWELYQKLHACKVEDVKTLFIKEDQKGVFYNQDDNNGNGLGDRIQIISPSKGIENNVNKSQNYNDISYVLLMTTRYNRKILFCGDSETSAWDLILERHNEELSNIDILIAPHHGRESGGNASYLDTLQPKLTLLGNAKSEHMDYSAWNNRKLLHYTNNQLGNAIFDDSDGKLKFFGTNRAFVFEIQKKRNPNIKERDLIKHCQYDAWEIECL